MVWISFASIYIASIFAKVSDIFLILELLLIFKITQIKTNIFLVDDNG